MQIDYFQDEILDFIELVRKSVPNAVEVFSKGNCGSFALMLAKAFPGGEIKHIIKLGHTIYEYNREWYDITGSVSSEYLSENNVKYEDAYEIFSTFGVGKAVLYLRPNYK